jgi:uncharacterized peroxidase-related enzyme
VSRLPAVPAQTASGRVRELLDAVQATLQITSNMIRVMANSPAVLEAYLSFSGALAGGALPPKLAKKLALEVGELNSCQYCVSAHTATGKMTGLTDAEIEAARTASSSSETEAAVLRFTRELITKRGRATGTDLKAVRAAGFTDGEIAEIIAHVALNIFTNYFNNATKVEIDFPKIRLRKRG